MDFQQILERAREIKKKFNDLEIKTCGKKWGTAEYIQGMAVDFGELSELIMAKNGLRKYRGESIDNDLAHELSDLLWSVIAISDELKIDITKEYFKSMDNIEKRLDTDNY